MEGGSIQWRESGIFVSRDAGFFYERVIGGTMLG